MSPAACFFAFLGALQQDIAISIPGGLHDPDAGQVPERTSRSTFRPIIGMSCTLSEYMNDNSLDEKRYQSIPATKAEAPGTVITKAYSPCRIFP